MNSCKPKIKILFAVWCFFYSLSAQAQFSSDVVDSSSSSRSEMQQHYTDTKSKNHSLFATSPDYHLIPQRNMITVTVGLDYLNSTIVPYGTELKGSPDSQQERLQLKGWETSPLIGFSADKFGLAFSADMGQKETLYYREYQLNEGTSSWLKQTSKATYSGLGLYAYYMPDLTNLPNFVQPTLIIGYKRLNVLHKFTPMYTELNPGTETNYRYYVRKIDYGLNIGVLLARYFTVFPWCNYTNRLLGTPTRSDNSEANSVNVDMLADQKFIWDSTQRWVWGIDFAVTFERINIHLGGAFSFVDNLTKGSSRVRDDSFSLSVTYNTKAR